MNKKLRIFLLFILLPNIIFFGASNCTLIGCSKYFEEKYFEDMCKAMGQCNLSLRVLIVPLQGLVNFFAGIYVIFADIHSIKKGFEVGFSSKFIPITLYSTLFWTLSLAVQIVNAILFNKLIKKFTFSIAVISSLFIIFLYSLFLFNGLLEIFEFLDIFKLKII